MGTQRLVDLPLLTWPIGPNSLVLYAGIGVLGLTVLVGIWLIWLGGGARRRRAYRRGRRALEQKDWRQALARAQAAQGIRGASVQWQGRLRNLEGEAHRLAAEEALQARQFSEGLTHLVQAAQLLALSEADAQEQVFSAMLVEVRRLFAAGPGPEGAAIHPLLKQVFQLRPADAEASFWQALCQVREGHPEEALASLRAAQGADGKRFFDPSLYLGMLLLGKGQPQEGLRYLAEANRIHAGCPILGWQLGQGILAAQGDAAMAVRVLQRALGPHGLPQWVKKPERAWVEGFPGGALSFVARLAVEHKYRCPVLGSDVGAMVKKAQMALGLAQYRQGQFADGVATYQKILQEAAPTLPVLRGLGLCLARLERYDEAYKHLRTVHEQEQQKNPLTAATLALCGARGKPSRPEDRPGNVSWSIRLLLRHAAPADAEWVQLANLVFAEARGLEMAVSADDQRQLVEALAAAHAFDPLAAAAYDHALATAPAVVRPDHAWLYCQAAAQHGFRGPRDLAWFQQVFEDPEPARRFFAERGWDFQAVEYTFLERWAERQPGRFPEVLGSAYAAGGEKWLLDRARELEAAGDQDRALAVAAVLQKLAPHSPAAHDLLARLHFRRGDADEALRVLDAWQASAPADPRPHVRRAAIEHPRGHHAAGNDAIERALALTQGRSRGQVAFLGARLALAAGQRREAARFLQECLAENPDDSQALWFLAALRCLEGDQAGMAALARDLDRPAELDGRLHYLAGACFLAAGDAFRAIEAVSRVAPWEALIPECHYLVGLAYLRHGNEIEATQALRKTAATPESPSVDHAKLVLGRLHFTSGAFDEAERVWGGVDLDKSRRWQLPALLPGVAFLAGLAALRAGGFERAAEKFREAELLGSTAADLVRLRQLALFKAGQRLLLPVDAAAGGPAQAELAARLLQKAIDAGAEFPQVPFLMGLALRRQGKWREAGKAFRQVAPADASVHHQLGLLALKESQLPLAEQEFARAWQLAPNRFAIGHNLLVARLALGRFEACAELVPPLAFHAQGQEAERFMARVQTLLGWFGGSDPATHRPLPPEEEMALLQLLRGLGQAEPVAAVLKAWLTTGRTGPAVREAWIEAVLLQAWQLLHRCEWTAAEKMLTPLIRDKELSQRIRAALLNLLACCTSLGQEMDAGLRYFHGALQLVPNDLTLQQNLALIHEWQDDLLKADPCWNRYLDLLADSTNAKSADHERVQQLRYETLQHLANLYSKKQVWASALAYFERASMLRKDDPEMLEKLYQLYTQMRRTVDARGVLAQLRKLRPNDAQYELFEIDLIEVRTVEDVERKVDAIAQAHARHHKDPRFRERIVTMIDATLPLIGRLCDQLSDQLDQLMSQLQTLPSNQINWRTVREHMRSLRQEYQRLRRITAKCMPLEAAGEHRQVLQELNRLLDGKIAFCERWEAR